jgi:hypothetical protein
MLNYPLIVAVATAKQKIASTYCLFSPEENADASPEELCSLAPARAPQDFSWLG